MTSSPSDTATPSPSPPAPEASPTGTTTAGTVTVSGALTGTLLSIRNAACIFTAGLTTAGALQGPAGNYSVTLTVADDTNNHQWVVGVLASPNSTSFIQYHWNSKLNTGGSMTPSKNGVTFTNLVVPSTGGTNGGPGQLTLNGGLTCVPLG